MILVFATYVVVFGECSTGKQFCTTTAAASPKSPHPHPPPEVTGHQRTLLLLLLLLLSPPSPLSLLPPLHLIYSYWLFSYIFLSNLQLSLINFQGCIKIRTAVSSAINYVATRRLLFIGLVYVCIAI
jgi:hypothetical protein